MTLFWQILAGNLAVVALIISAWAHFHLWLENQTGLRREVLFGVVMGAGTVASMLLSVELDKGVYYDLRSSLITASALFGGPVAAILTCAVAIAYRCALGGAGTLFGLIGIVLAGSLGVAAYALLAKRRPRLIHVVLLASAVPLCMFLMAFCGLLPVRSPDVRIVLIPIAFLNFTSIAVAGSIMLQIGRFSRERDLLRAALTQSPDFHYIKDRNSRFIAVNESVAFHSGYQRPAQLIGLTDFDLTTPARATKLRAAEQQIMDTGIAVRDLEEQVDTENGEKWFLTSKVALRSRDGDVIGLAGVTREITERKRLDDELASNRNLLAHAMTEMSDGLAMFSKAGELVFCNNQYRAFFPLTAHIRVPGTHIRDILRAAVETGEQRLLSMGDQEAWIDMIAGQLFTNNDRDINTTHGRWLTIRTRCARDGTSLVVVADITAMKESEIALKALTRQLKVLADTDGLTGLLNRRSFDQSLRKELGRIAETGKTLSILLIDIDRFKAYNDHYGHIMGDECLQSVSACLNLAKARAGDLVARFGGEEFVVLLPDTDEKGALAVAERFQSALKSRIIPHVASERGLVTASVGVSVCVDRDGLSPAEFVNRADEALYRAKGAGRDCIRIYERGARAKSA